MGHRLAWETGRKLECELFNEQEEGGYRWIWKKVRAQWRITRHNPNGTTSEIRVLVDTLPDPQRDLVIIVEGTTIRLGCRNDRDPLKPNLIPELL